MYGITEVLRQDFPKTGTGITGMCAYEVANFFALHIISQDISESEYLFSLENPSN